VNQPICIARELVLLAKDPENMMEDRNVPNVMEKEEWEPLDHVKPSQKMFTTRMNAQCAGEAVMCPSIPD